MSDPFTIRPHVITTPLEPPAVGGVLMFMACTRPKPSPLDIDEGRQLVGEWAYANLAIADGRAEKPPAADPGSFESIDLDEIGIVLSMMGQLRPIDGINWNDGWLTQAGGTVIYRWLCERLERVIPGSIDQELARDNPRQAALDAYGLYVMAKIKPEGEA